MKKLILLLFFLPLSLQAQCSGITNTAPRALPDNLDYYYVLDSKGTLTLPADSLTNPTGTSFDSFKSTILANLRTDATQSFADNWGITFTGMNTVSDGGDWDLDSQVLPLEYSQKILYSGGETVPTTGWTVYQAEWRVIANVDSDMVTAFGVPSGPWVEDRLAQLGWPPMSSSIPIQIGTSIAYGVFRVTCTDGFTSNTFDIRYFNIRPLFPDILFNYVNFNTGTLKFNASRAAIGYYLSLDDGLTWTGQGKGLFELQDLGANYRAISNIVMKFYSP